jgi:chemotaxis protein MotB
MTRLSENQKNPLSFQKSSNSLRSLKHSAEPANSNEIWLLTLSDLLMLLMIFFVFLLAAPIVQAGKSAQPQAAAGRSEQQTTTPSIPRQRATTTPNPVVSLTPDARDQQAVAALEDDLQRVLGNREDRQGVTVERRSQFLIITFPEQILFDSGKAQMKTAAEPTLTKVAAFIINHPELSVEVQGHTDDRPIRSQRYPSNWELSADRATQVARTLLELGANPRQVATKGFGEYRPVVPNLSDPDRLKNRRVEIQFSLPQS